jgi:hypothetical protein
MLFLHSTYSTHEAQSWQLPQAICIKAETWKEQRRYKTYRTATIVTLAQDKDCGLKKRPRFHFENNEQQKHFVIYTDHVILLRFLNQSYDGSDMSLTEGTDLQAYTEL